MTSECPTCGENFPSEQGMKTHHAIVHNESISGFEYECDFCGERVERKQRLDDQNVFCSSECFGEYKSDEWEGEDNPASNSKVVECDNCGSELSVCKSKLKENNFCDESCYGNWKSESMSGQNNPRWKEYIEKECPICGEIFSVKPAEKDERVTCSYACAAERFSDVFSGEDHPSWSGGYDDYYGQGWHDSRCLMIQKHNECQRCQNNENLHVHHIKPVRSFDDPTNAHHPENLIVVCRSCHPTVESMSESEQREKFK